MNTSNAFLLLVGFVTAGIILWLVRRDQLHGARAIAWVVTALLIPTLSLFPSLLDSLANVTGVNYPPALLFAISLVALILKALGNDIENAKLRKRYIRLTQRLAIIEARTLEMEPTNVNGAADNDSTSDDE